MFIPGGAPDLTVDMARRLSVKHDVQVIDPYGACAPYLTKLKEAGIETHVLCPESKDLREIGYRGKRLLRLWRTATRVPGLLQLRQRLIRKVREIGPDTIWTYSPRGLLFLNLSFPTLRYPLVMYECGCRDSTSICGFDRWLLRHRTAAVMAISTESASQLQLAGIPKERTPVVFDTIDLADILQRSEAPLDAPLPGLDKRPRVLLPAAVVRDKGQHTAIRAIRHLKSQGLDATLWLAGSAAEPSRHSYQAHLQALVHELHLSENVHFLGWRNDIPAIMRHADIVTLPTHTEGFGHVILEAMLLRRPVVATHVGGIKDSIEDGVNGLVFPVDDDEALARHLRRLASDNRLASMLVDNGYTTVTKTFSPDLHTQRVHDALTAAAGLAAVRI